MLIKASKVIGVPVFTIREGKRIKEIQEVIYHPKQNKIAAFIVDNGGWFSGSQVILFEDIVVLGEDAVLVDTAQVLKKASDVQSDIETITKSEKYLTDTQIITEKGEELGKVTDIYFDTKTGVVEEFEVSPADIKAEEKKRVKISDIITIGEDATIVKVSSDESPFIQNEEREHPKEPAAWNEADQSLAGSVGGQQEAVNTSSPAGPKTQTDMKNKANERRKKNAVGLYVTKNILTQNDKVLAKEGEMVTNRLIHQAEEERVLEQVLNNVTSRIQLSP